MLLEWQDWPARTTGEQACVVECRTTLLVRALEPISMGLESWSGNSSEVMQFDVLVY